MTTPDSEPEFELANQYVRRLMDADSDYRAQRDDRLDYELPNAISVADIESEVAGFRQDTQIVERVGIDLPVMRIGDELVPVALSLATGTYKGFLTPDSRDFLFVDGFYRFLRERELRSDYETVPVGAATETFARRAARFLATRISAVRAFERGAESWRELSMLRLRRHNHGSNFVNTPGCKFDVSTNSAGLRVFWSGAYRVSPNYFGQPTSPAESVLQSGSYIFGVDGGAYSDAIHWDSNAVSTLPGAAGLHLNF